MRGVSRFKALRSREGGSFSAMWSRMQDATHRAMGLLRLTPRQVAPPELKANFPVGSNRLMALTRMAAVQETARVRMEAERKISLGTST